MKKLKELLNGVNVGKVYGDTDREIGHIHFDSRKIEPGDVFIAQRGVNADGHAFIDKALTRGAVAVVCEQLPEKQTGRGNLYMDCRYLRGFGSNGRELLG